jgi:hypothetical protein
MTTYGFDPVTPISVYTPDTHKVVPKDAVVLDISHENLNVLVDYLDSNFRSGPITRSFIRQVREQTQPPRIPEPSAWGLVEAHTRENSDRRKFGRVPEADSVHWVESETANWFLWSELIDPVLIRDGIES